MPEVPAHHDPSAPPRDPTHTLFTRLRASTCAAERQLVEDEIARLHLPRARSLARRYARRQVELEDLMAVAALALVQAIRRFDPALGGFAPYATATIRGELKKHFRDHCWDVRPTRRIQELQSEVVQVRDERLQDDLAVRPEDLARRLGASTADIIEAMSAFGSFRAASLEALGPAGGPSLGDRIPADQHDTDRVELRLVALTGCAGLGPEELELVRMRFVDDLTQTEIARTIGTSQAQVSRRMTAILRRMRRAIGDLDPEYDHGSPHPRRVADGARTDLHRAS